MPKQQQQQKKKKKKKKKKKQKYVHTGIQHSVPNIST